jgi:hypothetical protein
MHRTDHVFNATTFKNSGPSDKFVGQWNAIEPNQMIATDWLSRSQEESMDRWISVASRCL